MPNIVNTSINVGSVALSGEEFRDELLVFTGIATVIAGTLLARRKVATAVTASAVTGTGNGTVTAASVVAGPLPLVGVYTLKVVRAVANGGEWQLTDPNGEVVSSDLVMTIGAGAATVFKAGGLQFTITDGSTDFALADTATLTVAADGKMVPFSLTGVGGAQVPCAVLGYDVTSTGAGNVPIRALVAGKVNKTRLVIDADGTGANIDSNILDQLRSFSIVPIDVLQTSS